MNRFLLAALLAAAGATAFLFLARKPAPSVPPAPAKAPTAIDPATAGTIRGRVRFSGPVPAPKEIRMSGNPECSALHPATVPDDSLLVKDGALRNAVVYVKKGLEAQVFAPPASAVEVDQRGCLFLPRVACAQVNQPVAFLNSDPTKHNVHGVPKRSESFNRSLARKGTRAELRIPASEVGIPITCDLHAWMTGWLCVFDHPFFRTTGEDGAFEMKGLPPGEYVLEAWHERLGALERTVTVPPSGEAAVEFVFERLP